MKGLLFTYVLTYGGAVAGLFNPFIGLLIYVAFAILRPDSLWSFSVPAGNYSRIVAIALLIGWAARGFGKWDLGRAKAVVVAFVGYWLWAAISAIFATNTATALGFLQNNAKVLLPFLVGITTITSVRQVKQLVWVIVLCQGYLAYEFNVSYFQGFNRVMTLGFGGMDEGSLSIAMTAGVGLTFALGLSSRRWYAKFAMMALALLMLHFVLFSFSRGGMLGVIATLAAIFLLFPRKRPSHYLAFVIVGWIGLTLAGQEVRQEFMTIFSDQEERDYSAQSRLDLWSNCVDAILKRPLVGVGPDHFPLIAADYGWTSGKEAHHLWLQLGAELGLPGVLLLFGFYVICVWRLWALARGRGEVPDPWFRSLAQGTIASFAGFLVASQFITLEGLELPYYVNLAGAAVLKLSSVIEPVGESEPEKRLHQRPASMAYKGNKRLVS